MKTVAEFGRLVYMVAAVSMLLAVSLAAWIFRSVSSPSLALNHPNRHLSEKQAAAILAEREEAADARKKAARHMLDATNFSPWL